MSRRNFLVADDGVRLVDWAAPARGAAWIDVALLVVRLIRYGHRPAEAERLVESVPSWRVAEPDAVTEWCAALTRMLCHQQAERPAPHRGPLLEAARSWLAFRRQR